MTEISFPYAGQSKQEWGSWKGLKEGSYEGQHPVSLNGCKELNKGTSTLETQEGKLVREREKKKKNTKKGKEGDTEQQARHNKDMTTRWRNQTHLLKEQKKGLDLCNLNESKEKIKKW